MLDSLDDAAAGASAGESCGLCCGPFRMTRCPRWFAIVVALCCAASALGGLVLLIVDAIQRFQAESLNVYINQASKLADDLQRWLALFNVHLDAEKLLEALRSQISLFNFVQTTLTFILEGVGNMILILLLVLYLLAEQSTHSAGRCVERWEPLRGRPRQGSGH
jgi:predicted PurR-regulated permease PerM